MLTRPSWVASWARAILCRQRNRFGRNREALRSIGHGIAFTTGRDRVLSPERRGGPLDYFLYPYAEVADQPVVGIGKSFRFRRVKRPFAAR